jgi:hypothetical protein
MSASAAIQTLRAVSKRTDFAKVMAFPSLRKLRWIVSAARQKSMHLAVENASK